MQKITLTALLITLSVAAGVSQAASEERPVDRRGVPPIPPPWTRRPLVQIAVVLDAGPGMSALIHQAVTTEKELVQLQEKARARRQIEEQILQLAAQRRVYLLIHQPQSESARPTLGQAVIQVIREQATTTP